MAAEKESAETQTGAAGAYYEKDAFTVLLETEYAELEKKIAEYKAILADRKLLLGVIKKEILVISEKYGDDRRTAIGFDEYDISTEDLIPREDVVITMTKMGYIKNEQRYFQEPESWRQGYQGYADSG